MTDHHDPLTELASAHLDGETSPEEDARLLADPAATARLDRLAATREAIRSELPAVAEERRDAAIQAALAAYDASGHSVVTPITAAASRRGPTRTLALVGAAAALALLALLVPLLGRLDDGSRDQVAGPEAASDALRAGDSAGGTGSDGGASTLEDPVSEGAFAPPASSSDLGSFDDLPSLTDAVRAELAAPESTQAPASSGGNGGGTPICPDDPDADGVVVYRALAVLDGRAVVAYVREDPDGGRTLVVLDRQDCSAVAGGKL